MKRKEFSVIFLILFFCFFSVFIFIVPLWAKDISREIGLLLERFNWKEFAPNGLILEESGVRKGINITWWDKEVLPYYIFGDYTIYGGTVEHNVRLRKLGKTSFSGEVSYLGIRVETIKSQILWV